VIEHNLDVIKTADWVVDLDLKRDNAGRIIAVGTPEQIAANKASYTGHYLRATLAAARGLERKRHDRAVRVTGQFAPLMGGADRSLGWGDLLVGHASLALERGGDPVHGIDCPAHRRQVWGGAARLPAFELELCSAHQVHAVALSAAKLPFAVPANVPLGFIMVCGYAASFALLVSVTALAARQVPCLLERGLGPGAVDRIRAGRPAGHSRAHRARRRYFGGPGNPGILKVKRAGVARFADPQQWLTEPVSIWARWRPGDTFEAAPRRAMHAGCAAPPHPPGS